MSIEVVHVEPDLSLGQQSHARRAVGAQVNNVDDHRGKELGRGESPDSMLGGC